MKGKKPLSANTRNARTRVEGRTKKECTKCTLFLHYAQGRFTFVTYIKKTNTMIEIIIRQILGLIKLLFQQLCNIFEPRASRCLELKLIGGDAAQTSGRTFLFVTRIIFSPPYILLYCKLLKLDALAINSSKVRWLYSPLLKEKG